MRIDVVQVPYRIYFIVLKIGIFFDFKDKCLENLCAFALIPANNPVSDCRFRETKASMP